MTATIEGAARPVGPASRALPTPPDPGRLEPRGWLAALVAIGAVLRVWGLGASRPSYDESFTAMAGRLPLGQLFGYLRVHDSHPPLDYLLHAPFVRAGMSELWLRMPSVACSIAALALFAWWMRGRGRVGVIATALLAVDTFQVVHGRDARMYAELELIGVAAAVLGGAWLQRPRRWHAGAVAALVLTGLLTHVSMLLLGAGLLVLPGRRVDRDAWRWRAGLAAGFLGWALLWGPTFLVQAQGGHSDWIAPTTLWGLAAALGQLVFRQPDLYLVAVGATAVGGVLLWRRDRQLSRLWLCCFAVPVVVASIAGFFAPVVLDRTFTVVAWAPVLAIAFVIDALASCGRAFRIAAVAAVVAVLIAMVPTTVRAIDARKGPDTPLRRIERVVQPGDVVAIHPATKSAVLRWSLGVRGRYSSRGVHVRGLANAQALAVGSIAPTGRVWVLDWRHYRSSAIRGFTQCAPTWHRGRTRVLCLSRLRARTRVTR